MGKFRLPGLGMDLPDAPSDVLQMIVGTDPGGSEPMRVGGSARVSGYLTVGSGATVRGNGTFAGAGMDCFPVNLANLATAAIGDGNTIAIVLIAENAAANAAIVLLRGGAHAVTIVQAINGTWGTTAGAANNYNVYWDAGTATYRVENRIGSLSGFYIQRVGQVPS